MPKITGKKGGCFPPNTLIATPRGAIRIKDIEVGQEVYCYNKAHLVVGTVTQVHKHKTADLRGDKLVRIEHEYGKLLCTANHYIYIGNNKYKEAGELTTDDYVYIIINNKSKVIRIVELPDIDYVYNLTVEPFHNFIAGGVRVHNKGGGKGGGSQHIPYEAENSLQSNTVVRLIDLIGEGEIVGLVNGDKSIYLDETPLQSDSGAYNYDGITTYIRTGTPTQSYIPGITDNTPNTTIKNIKVTNTGGGVTHTISDTDVDDVKIVIRVPALYTINNDGDVLPTSVQLAIDIQPNGGNWTTIGSYTIKGKCNSPYDKQYRINNLDSYGSGPWTIRVRRITGDSSSNKLINDIYFYSVITIKNRKIQYRDSAIVGFRASMKEYGQYNIPNRYYDVYGLKIRVPANRDQDVGSDTVTYNGAWDGTFKTAWCDNPAWIVYDLLTNDRYGLGLDDEYVDKWALYSIGYYNDQLVDDGQGGQERRYTFNYALTTSTDAIQLINDICNTMRVMPYWSAGMVTFVQDKPRDATRLVTAANTIDGMFNYSGPSLEGRHTVVYVTWYDPDNYCRPAIEVVEDVDAIKRYGYKPIDVVAMGCTSRGQAHRYGKWILETEQSETDIVTYTAGLDHIDAVPGEIVNIVDPSKSITGRFGGRLKICSSTNCTIDNSITIESGKSYTVSMMTPSGTVIDRDLTNNPGTTDTLTWTNSIASNDIPLPNSIWVVSVSDLQPKPYRIVNVKEINKHQYKITAVYNDPNKYSRIESGIYLSDEPYTNIPVGAVDAPSSLTLEPYTYQDGSKSNQKYGILVSWAPVDDPRVVDYEIQYHDPNNPYQLAGTTTENSYKLQPVNAGTYNVRVRANTATAHSAWTNGTIDVVTTTSGLLPPTNLELVYGGTTFSGVDIPVHWTASSGCYYRDRDITVSGVIAGYKIEIINPSNDNILRTVNVPAETLNYTYTYNDNLDDNTTPLRSIKIKVYTQDVYGQLSPPVTNTFTNPAPDMSSSSPTLTPKYTSLRVEWPNVNDNDMDYYNIYCDTNNPPTTLVDTVKYPTNIVTIPNLDYGTDYYVQIEPYDAFGAGAKSQIPHASPLQIPDINIDAELTSSIDITDSANTASGTLAELYDRTYNSGGPSYSTTSWINYNYNMEYFIDRIGIWTSAATKIYVAYKRTNGAWQYLKAESDHTLTNDNELLAASSESDAQTNYWLTNAGKNIAIFPQGVIAEQVRVHIYNPSSTVTIHELIPAREVIAEFVTADTLSAISADLGTIQAGSLQSADWSSSQGVYIDLDTEDVKFGGSSNPKLHWDGSTLTVRGKIIVEGSSSGYNNFTDKPDQLSDINSSEGSKLSSVEYNADVTGNHTANNTNNVSTIPASNVAGWAHSSNTTYIDGGKIYTNSITANQIAAHTITSNELVTNSAVITTSAQIANAIVESAHIKDANITNAKIANAAITSAKIADANVTTLKIANNAVTIPDAYYTTAGANTSGSWIDLATITHSWQGGKIVIIGSSKIHCYLSTSNNASVNLQMRILGDGGVIWETGSMTPTLDTNYTVINVLCDMPVTGVCLWTPGGSNRNVTIKLQGYGATSPASTITFSYRSLVVLEAKR